MDWLGFFFTYYYTESNLDPVQEPDLDQNPDPDLDLCPDLDLDLEPDLSEPALNIVAFITMYSQTQTKT